MVPTHQQSEADNASRKKKVVLKKLPATGGTMPATGGTLPATGDTVPATGGKLDTPAKFGKGGPKIFDNGYFFLKSNELDLKMFIHERWTIDPPLGIGRLHQKSKTITPSKVGEARADPVRSMLVLKAWMIWRARIILGWIESNDTRQRLFTEEADLVLAQLKRLQPQTDGLLGSRLGSQLMREFVPDIVGRM